MRFLRLDLRAFGPFADAPPVDLSGGSHGLHLIHGPNEAGKSSALRAIRALFFGFPLQSPDNHRHAFKDLRVGATIRGIGGEELAFLRRKGDVRTIRKYDDDGVIAEETLAGFLDGLDRARFDDLCAMDHAELIAGGRAIIQGKGNLGSILFAAGSGLSKIDTVRKSLDEEMEDLFKPTGKNPAINLTLAGLKAAREASERAMLATSDWVQVDKSLKEAWDNREAVNEKIRQATGEKRNLERQREAFPLVTQIGTVLRSLDVLGDVPVLSEGFSDRRFGAIKDREICRNAAFAAESALEVTARDLDALGPRDPVLDEADAIRRIRDNLGLYRKALESRPGARARLARLEADALGLLRELRPDAPSGLTPPPPLPAALKVQIREFLDESSRIEAALKVSEDEVARRLADCPGPCRNSPPPDAAQLAEALAEASRQVQARGDLEDQIASARADLAGLEAQAAINLKALPLWSGSLDGLEVLSVPSTVTLDHFEAESRSADEALARAETDLAKFEVEKADLDRQIDRGQVAGQVPTEEELADRRARRDDRWRLVRRAWLDREAVEEPSRLADEFESSLWAADGLADRLRSEADAVAEQAQRHWRRREILDQVAAVASGREKARRERERVEAAWVDLWGPLGIAPLSPREMKDWVAIHQADLVRQSKAIRVRRAEIELQLGRVEEARSELGWHLGRLGEPPAEPGESLAALLARATRCVNRVGDALHLEAARVALAKDEAARDDWRARWADAVEPLGLAVDATPQQALAVLALFEDLTAKLREVDDLRAEVDEHARSEARFEEAVRSLDGRLQAPSTPALHGPDIEATAREFSARFDGARIKEAQRERDVKRREDERSRLEAARRGVDLAEAALAALVAEAGCGSPEGLVEAERASEEVKSLRNELRALEGQLATLAGPIPPGAFREQLEGAEPESLEGRIAELTDRLAPLELERDRLGEEIGRSRQKLEAMDGGPAAADAQQAVEERVARLAADVEKYASLRLASAVLREAVERYRKEHQGPVLDRAGALFAALTAGSFAGLRADVDDQGQPVLLGVRADGATLLKVDGMSEGTADQLYLSLRLASLHAHLDDHEPMPLVVDDVLVNFDNARALAALRALADLSRRTQVLFFTHHDHLVDLARSTLGDDLLFVHRLAFPPVGANAPDEPSTPEAPKPKRKKKAASLAEGS